MDATTSRSHLAPEDNPFSCMKGHPRFYELLCEAAELHHSKNQDYANAQDPFANFRSCEKAGISMVDGIYTRMSDKWERITNLLAKRRDGLKAAVASETLKDTLMDLAVYALIETVALEEAEDDVPDGFRLGEITYYRATEKGKMEAVVTALLNRDKAFKKNLGDTLGADALKAVARE